MKDVNELLDVIILLLTMAAMFLASILLLIVVFMAICKGIDVLADLALLAWRCLWG